MLSRHQRVALRHAFVLALIAIVFATVFAIVTQAPAHAADGIGQLVKLRGEVAINRGGADAPATAGMALALHDTVKTGAKSRAQIQFADGSTVTLGENSALAI